MYLKALGELAVDPDIEEWFVSEPIALGFFGGLRLPFVVEDIEDQEPVRFESAVDAFLKLGTEARDLASSRVYANYQEFVAAVDADEVPVRIDRAQDVWSHVKPIDVHVCRPEEGPVYVVVYSECDWELEHGLQLVFEEGTTLTRVSAQDGHFTD